jgi:MYND finger
LRNDGVTLACARCGQAFAAVGRRRFCSAACRQAAWRQRHPTTLPPPLPARLPRATIIYECTTCDTRLLGEQRCPDCHRFGRRLGPGGPCPHCEEPVAISDLIQDGGR